MSAPARGGESHLSETTIHEHLDARCVLYGKQRAFHFHAKCVIKRPLRDRPGSIERIDHKEIPPKVEYSLTPFGRSQAQALGPLCRWGTDYTLAVERINERRMAALVQP